MSELFVVDLGIHVAIRPGSTYQDLLWKVIDTRAYAHERGAMINRGLISQNPHHYYFTSPRAAANLFRWKYDASDPRIQAFFERRADLLAECGIAHGQDSWWHHKLFESKQETAEAIRPPRSYEFCARLVKSAEGGLVFDKTGMMSHNANNNTVCDVVGTEVPTFLGE